jgi:hypothetical protein
MTMKKVKNLAAASPLLRKGGVHLKSKTGQRMKEKQDLRKSLAVRKSQD